MLQNNTHYSSFISAVEENTDGKGFASSFWDWITYPFTGWGGQVQEEVELPQTLTIITPIIQQNNNKTQPGDVQTPEGVPQGPQPGPAVDNVDSESQNLPNEVEVKPKSARLEGLKEPKVTVMCNEQTCSTTVCPVNGSECKVTSCNIYDTNMKGECQQFAHLQMSTTIHADKSDTTIAPSKEVAFLFITDK